MLKFVKVSLIVSLVFLSGCAGPRITGKSIPVDIISNNPEVLSINDGETREGFQEVVEGWLESNNKHYTVKSDGSKHDLEKVTLEYSGKWGWDLALYLREADIEAFYAGQRISKVTFRAPNSLNTNKWGSAEDRINLMLDVMFGKKTSSEATADL